MSNNTGSDSNQQLGQSTSITLLQGIRNRQPEHWERFVRLYSPLVYEWCRRAKVGQQDAADVTQEVFKSVAIKVDNFHRDREGDSFRGWLWGITRFKILDHFRAAAARPQVSGGSTAQLGWNRLADEVPEAWDDQQISQDKRALYDQAVELLQSEFEQSTYQAFLKVAVDGRSPADVARELGMTVGAVYNAKYKVLRRLRTEFDGFT